MTLKLEKITVKGQSAGDVVQLYNDTPVFLYKK